MIILFTSIESRESRDLYQLTTENNIFHGVALQQQYTNELLQEHCSSRNVTSQNWWHGSLILSCLSEFLSINETIQMEMCFISHQLKTNIFLQLRDFNKWPRKLKPFLVIFLTNLLHKLNFVRITLWKFSHYAPEIYLGNLEPFWTSSYEYLWIMSDILTHRFDVVLFTIRDRPVCSVSATGSSALNLATNSYFQNKAEQSEFSE